jgi:ketosteroid isomerase-like protein
VDESWKVNNPEAVTAAQAIWDALEAGDPMPALEVQAENVVYDNGPGAGPWRHTEGRDEFVEMMGNFFPLFGDSFRQRGRALVANEQFAIVLVSETGVHAESGEVFDNRAIYVSRFDAEGKVDHTWTVDLDSEDMERFWERNPVRSPEFG